ncbi:Ribosomal biogenesis protein las1l [Physocladia obscura]|uniref:Ribosomal biogenesis protein las1l n=1 Tax=Physocladia obscura TaxID=109957 RepID=A0AAD5SS93_9FUNG|nr:Ribosomal biogenesis protein las1l [Physocladia obscura]
MNNKKQHGQRVRALEGRRTAWATHAEWSKVYRGLYTFDIAAVRRVKAWASRINLPLSVEITALFVEIGIRDAAQHISQLEIRLMYTLAFIRYTQFLKKSRVALESRIEVLRDQVSIQELIGLFCRFVNGIADSEQRGEYAASVAGIAAAVGLPAWFVELRHAGTHDRLPAIAVLRAAARQALTWLDVHYWQAHTEYYRDTRAATLRLLRAHFEANPAETTNNIRDIVTSIRGEDYTLFLIPNLILPGILVPNDPK